MTIAQAVENNKNTAALIRGDSLKYVFEEELSALGKPFVPALSKVLKSKGITLDQDHYYSEKEIEAVLLSVFGHKVAPSLIKLLEVGLKKNK